MPSKLLVGSMLDMPATSRAGAYDLTLALWSWWACKGRGNAYAYFSL